jgi:glycosyltransferase involved in cell wall biosynthesis
MASLKYSIIVPAYNEETLLTDTLISIKEAMLSIADDGEFIVVDNNSDDNTADIAESMGARVVFEPFNQIARARNKGGENADGEFLIFIDADTHISPELLKSILEDLKSKQYCGGGAVIKFDTELKFLAKVALGAWTFASKKLKLAAGSCFYCTKEGFDAVGGFEEKVYASEEIWFSRRLRKWGKTKGMDFKISEIPVITSGRKFNEYSRFKLFLLLCFHVFIPFAIFSRKLSGFWYTRRKAIR